MIIQNPELLNQLSEWRRKSADGSITLDEMREAIRALRQNRVTAETSGKPRAKKSSTPVVVGDLLDQLKGL